MFRRLAGAFTATALVATGLVVGISVAASAEPALTVPSRPAGDVTVTAVADAGSNPYLQVKLTRSDLVTEPYPSMTAIATPPVENPGEPVDVVVPTWGLSDNVLVTFVLLGCSTDDPQTCTSLLATDDEYLWQDTVWTEFYRPTTGALLVPQEELHVGAYGSEGGRMTAVVDGSRTDIPFGRTDLTAALDKPLPDGRNLGSTEIELQRCSAVNRDEVFCEDVASAMDVEFLRRIAPIATPGSTRPFTMDPTWSSSSQTWTVETETLGADYTLTWELRDPTTNAVLVRPQDVPSASSSSVSRDAVIKPADHVQDLPDGTYEVVLTATVARTTGIQLQGSSSTSIEVLNDPPLDMPQVREADRIVRNLAHGEIRTAHFVVDAFDYGQRAELVLREDRSGVDVLHRDVGVPGFCPECANRKGFDFDLYPYGDDNHLLQPRTYTARLRTKDTWGRPIEVPLGKIYFQDTKLSRVRATALPAKVRVRGTRHVGRCSTLRTPDPAGVRGSLWFRSLSRCSSLRGYDDVVRQRLRIRVPEPTGDVDRISSVRVYHRAWGRGPGVARAACRLSETSWHTERVERRLRWRYLCGAGVMDSWDDAGTSAHLKFRVARGERLDLRRVRVAVSYWEWYTPR
jgi:hypothetical protein